jgi:alpha-glucosidase (family GH31 glycosyl hydrolase)
LKDYFKRLNREASEKGLPVTRALLLNYPSDSMTYDLKDEFLLGDDLPGSACGAKRVQKRKSIFPG